MQPFLCAKYYRIPHLFLLPCIAPLFCKAAFKAQPVHRSRIGEARPDKSMASNSILSAAPPDSAAVAVISARVLCPGCCPDISPLRRSCWFYLLRHTSSRPLGLVSASRWLYPFFYHRYNPYRVTLNNWPVYIATTVVHVLATAPWPAGLTG